MLFGIFYYLLPEPGYGSPLPVYAKHRLAGCYLSNLFLFKSYTYMDKYTPFVLHSETSVCLIVPLCFTSGWI